jgi:two-component system response regulator DevR
VRYRLSVMKEASRQLRPDTENPTRLSPPGGPCNHVAMSAPPLRVMLVDDHEVVRDGIKLLLADTDDVVVCAEAGSAREAVATAARALPDVIVMDVRLSDGSGIEATRDIRAARPHTRVLMLTSFADDEALFASIMAGAAGYVLKQIRGEELVRAIRAVGAGQNLLDPAVTKGVFDRLRKGKHLLRDERLARLSPQEERILGLVAEGRTNGQIAAELGLAEKTVKNYVSAILAKLEVARRAEAAAYLARHTTLPGA